MVAIRAPAILFMALEPVLSGYAAPNRALSDVSDLAGVRAANSRSAMMFALALVFSLVLAAALASMVTAPLRRMANATRMIARGDLSVRVQGSKLEELGILAAMFNDMAAKLKKSFDRSGRRSRVKEFAARELQESEARLRASEERWRLGCSRTRRSASCSGPANHDRLHRAGAAKALAAIDFISEEEREEARRRLAELRRDTPAEVRDWPPS